MNWKIPLNLAANVFLKLNTLLTAVAVRGPHETQRMPFIQEVELSF
ncbi:hypothetical protein LEP1GSC074_3960 [Leptospira noguchii str. Hook]|uniref:Uncharacterized protein n=2 Tax=Leptospira noguchii TaxID=28182 RepID=M6U7N0_9LEPT|nr:hypothetical protein LEP1GSC035_4306 [Leptospira noguchii str. 2007001578]EMO38956.1 hypothetical protein LEP1GSC186_0222 [Leptospira noguchii serovar Autumnalis str. ZUN142]EMS85247.1 hypothetical protein LEP1GSC074_3960 [Leptospira noguchii str. Hook]